MFSVNFAKFVRTYFIKKTTRILEKHKDFHRATQKITLKMRLKKFSGRPFLFVCKDQNILIIKEGNGCPQAVFSEKQNQVIYITKKICNTTESS